MQRHMRASARDGAPVLLLEVLVDLAAARAHVDDPHARAQELGEGDAGGHLQGVEDVRLDHPQRERLALPRVRLLQP